jgi:chromosome segregation ATPase
MRRVFLAVGAVSAVTPVQKVITMIEEMAAKGKTEKHDESVAFSAFSQWCKDVSAEKKNNISNASAAIEQNSAKIAKAEADAAALGRSITDLEAQIGTFNTEHDDAKALRAKENKDFRATQTDYEESIDALGRAKGILKSQSHDRKQAETALIQVSSLSTLSSSQKEQIAALLQKSKQDPDFLSRSAPEANAYEFQSGGIVGMFETLES